MFECDRLLLRKIIHFQQLDQRGEQTSASTKVKRICLGGSAHHPAKSRRLFGFLPTVDDRQLWSCVEMQRAAPTGKQSIVLLNGTESKGAV